MESAEQLQAGTPLLQPADFGIAQLFEHVPDAVYVFDRAASRIVLWNDAAAKIFGYAEAEIVGQPLEFLVPGTPRRALDDFGTRVVTAYHKAGPPLKIEVSTSPIRGARVSGEYMLGIFRDVTAREATDALLRERAALLDITHDALFVLDLQLHITYWNRAAERMYGWSAPEANGQVGFELLHTRFPTPLSQIRATLWKTGIWEGELIHTKRDGSLVVAASRWALRRDAQGTPVSILDTNNDVSARKRAEAEMLRKSVELEQANRELRLADHYKDEFLGALSHELRTPLNFIVSYASVLDEEVAGALNAEVHEYLGKVLYGADRLLLLVDNLLDLSRLLAGKFELAISATLFSALVEQAIATMTPVAEEKQIVLTSDVQFDQEVWIDGDRVRQALLNLLDNAIKFTPKRGHVAVLAVREGNELVVKVSDTGIGIAAQDIPKLFGRFKQLDMSSTRVAGGMGVGLSLTKAVIEQHGGTLGVESQPGAGSMFWFRLPIPREPDGPPIPPR